MKLLTFLCLFALCSCSEKVRVEISSHPITNEIAAPTGWTSEVASINKGIDDLNREWTDAYFQLAVCKKLLGDFGIVVTKRQSNGVPPWMEITSTNTDKVLRIPILQIDPTKKGRKK